MIKRNLKKVSPQPRGNLCVKPKRISDNPDKFTLISDYVGTKRSVRERVTSNEVLDMLIAENICQIKSNFSGLYHKSDYHAALRSVQKYLKRNGFLRGKCTGSIQQNPDHLAWRN